MRTVTEADVQATIDATYGGRSLEQSLKDLDDYEAEQKQQDENPQGHLAKLV
ncbi:MAG: hypothetical protein R3Y56_03530 [Akkermansia sp.]